MLDFDWPGGDKRRPMAVQVKICGITGVEAADAAVRAGADFGGLVFHAQSPRRVSAEQAAQLSGRMRRQMRVVAVLADPGNEEVAKAISAAQPDFIQLHGHESPERVMALRVRFGRPVIKAVSVADVADFACVSAYEAVADMLLFDAKPPAGAVREGGHGAAFDWQLLSGRSFKRSWLLAGGLHPGNIARAIRTAQPPGVDVSSGVETSPGIKDAELIRSFVANARTTESLAEPGI